MKAPSPRRLSRGASRGRGPGQPFHLSQVARLPSPQLLAPTTHCHNTGTNASWLPGGSACPTTRAECWGAEARLGLGSTSSLESRCEPARRLALRVGTVTVQAGWFLEGLLGEGGWQGRDGVMLPQAEWERPPQDAGAPREGGRSGDGAPATGQPGRTTLAGCGLRWFRDAGGVPCVVPSGPFPGRRCQCWGRPPQTGPHPSPQGPTWHPGACARVSNWQPVFKTAASLQNRIRHHRCQGRSTAGGRGPGLAGTGAPGTADALCHCGQLSVPAASCHGARHKTYPLSDPASGAEPEAASISGFVTHGPPDGT